MTNKPEVSDEYLNSYVDNQLDPTEKIHAFNTIRQDDKLKERVCELRGMKEIIQQAYSQPPVYRQAQIQRTLFSARYFQALAACLLLLLGGASGWFTHAWTSEKNSAEATAALQLPAHAHNEAIAESRKVIIHLGHSNPARLKATLEETESMLETYKRSRQPLQIEVVANKSGVDLLRADKSAYGERIGLMQTRYPNLNFLVCGQTLGKLSSKGESIQLLPRTNVVPSAAEQINKRLQQGWGYVRI